MKDKINNIIKKGKPEDAEWKDKQEMLSLFHQPEKEYLLKENLFEELHNYKTGKTTSSDYKKMFTVLLTKIERDQTRQKTKIKYLNTFLKIAAAVVVGLFIGIYVSSVKTTHPDPAYYAAHSPKGSVSEMLLPDGSVIFLNADSRIKYSANGQNHIREVFLDGEAWFDVAKNKKRPFVVHTPSYDVNVTGTRFNVKAYESEQEVTTTLEEGQVIIKPAPGFNMDRDVVLKPGQQISFDKTTQGMVIRNVNTKWFTSWKDNKLIFVNMSLQELEVLLERKYGVDIEVKNKEILDLHFDGTIKNESIIEILEIIKKTLPINYQIVGQKIEITGEKQTKPGKGGLK